LETSSVDEQVTLWAVPKNFLSFVAIKLLEKLQIKCKASNTQELASGFLSLNLSLSFHIKR